MLGSLVKQTGRVSVLVAIKVGGVAAAIHVGLPQQARALKKRENGKIIVNSILGYTSSLPERSQEDE